MRKWILAFFLLIIAVIVAFSIFVVTGVIDGPALFWSTGMKIGFIEPHLKIYAIGRDAEEWVAVKTEELQLKIDALNEEKVELEAERLRLEQRAQQLDNREATIVSSSQKLLGEQEQRKNVQTLATLYTEMGPFEAAKILEKLDKKLVLDVLLSMEMQDAASILIELPTNLTVTLSEQLGQVSQ